MSERKVLNKYYPPDFDPSKIPRVKRDHNKTFTVRLMAPFNMKCTTCGEYIYKGRKFNARKEDVENEDFLGLRIYRFYIKCTRCLAEISFKTDPASTDYVIDAGATRNFMALKMAEEQAAKEEEARKEVEASNPMQMLENRTKQSREEIEAIESLEELREMNKRQQTLNYEGMLDSYEVSRQKARELQIKKAEEEDEELVNRYFGTKDDGTKIKRLVDDDGPQPKVAKTDMKKGSVVLPQLPKGLHMTKPTLAGLVKKKEPAKPGQAQCAGGKPNQPVSTSDVGKRVVDDVPSLVIPVLKASKDRPIAHEPVKVEVLANEQSSSSSGLPGITGVGNAVSDSFSYATNTVGNSKTQSTKIKATGLSLLGAYSSESDSSDD